MANPLFGKNETSPHSSKGLSYIIGRVKDIVLGPRTFNSVDRDPDYKSPRDIGKIRFEVLYTTTNLSKLQVSAKPAYPMFGFLKQFPLLHEIVLIVPGPDPNLNDSIDEQGLYYFPPFSVWNSPQHNAFPNMLEVGLYLSSITGVGSASNMVAIPVGKTFEEKKDIRRLRPFEGDTIVESRFGSSIRFGSSVTGTSKLNSWSNFGKNGSPITIIRNGQGLQPSNDYFDTMVENVNKDPSSIFLTNGQSIDIEDIDKYPKGSYGSYKDLRSTTVVVERTIPEQDIESAGGFDRRVIPTSEIE